MILDVPNTTLETLVWGRILNFANGPLLYRITPLLDFFVVGVVLFGSHYDRNHFVGALFVGLTTVVIIRKAGKPLAF